MSTTKIHSTCRIANIGPDDAMILAHTANPDGSNFRKGQATRAAFTGSLPMAKRIGLRLCVPCHDSLITVL
jgi:hypothetical protein